MSNLRWNVCEQCKEKTLISKVQENVKCHHGSKCWEYSVLNNMDPGDVPKELQVLTFIEEQIIARIHPQITVFKVKGHQYAYKGNVISFPQDVQELAVQLPHKVKDLNSVVCMKYKTYSGNYHEFNVRSGRVREALVWLKQNNPYYKDIIISEENLKLLPEDGNVMDSVNSILHADEDDAEIDFDNEDHDEEDEILNESGVANMSVQHQDEVIKSKLKWPSISNQPVNERQTPGFFPCAYPKLFPYGTADLNDDRLKDMKMANYIKHLMNYCDNRFASHLTFRFFVYNIWMRNTALQDGNVFVRNNPEFQNMTVAQLKEKISENENVMKQIMFQASNLKGSKAYWRTRANELQDMVEQLGLPTIFLTLSAADGHWEDLYRLLTDTDVSLLTEGERRRLVQQNPHIVDSFFAHRVESFIKNVSQKVKVDFALKFICNETVNTFEILQVMETNFKVVDYWYRIEYQHR